MDELSIFLERSPGETIDDATCAHEHQLSFSLSLANITKVLEKVLTRIHSAKYLRATFVHRI